MNRFIIVIFFLAMIGITAEATRISPGKITIDFEPNKVQTFDFFVGGAPAIEVKGDAGYGIKVEVGKIEDRGDNMYFLVKITMPESVPLVGDRIEVGGISAYEVAEGSSSMISTRTAVMAPIYLNVPYEGQYVVMSLEVPHVNVDEELKAYISATNLGELDVLSGFAQAEIYGFGGMQFDKKIATLVSDSRAIKSRQRESFILVKNTTGWNPGEYKAIATVFYDNNQTNRETYFNVGNLNVIITNYTREVIEGQINPFDVDIESRWNNRIPNIFAEVTINGTSFKTPSVELEPWGKAKLNGYWDTKNVKPGTYDAMIRVFYIDQTKTEIGKVTVKEKEKGIKINMTTWLIIIIALLVLIDIFILFRRKRKRVVIR